MHYFLPCRKSSKYYFATISFIFSLFPLAHSFNVYRLLLHNHTTNTKNRKKPTHIYVNSKNAATIRNSLTDTFPLRRRFRLHPFCMPTKKDSESHNQK